ncbi:MAG TPA: hypothetical protein VFS32_14110 [Candidatus Limnocylindrales bacterium]|nr:hypothetical protein [Candidatus Limnocylindrales bacterium]
MRIYLQPNLLTLETPAEAAAQLDHLADAGAELVVVAEAPLPEWEDLGVPALSYEGDASSGRRDDWWLTADPEDCGARPGRGVRSILVGGAYDPGPGGSRCDVGAPNLRAAVLEILSRQAMPSPVGPTD